MPKKDEVEPVVCGHVNKQHYGTKGKLEDLACTLPAGHEGAHSAPYKRLVATPITDEKGRVVKNDYEEVDDVGHWVDMAGTPADQVYVGAAEQMTLYQRDMVLQLIRNNPKLTVDQAIAQASAKEDWKQSVR